MQLATQTTNAENAGMINPNQSLASRFARKSNDHSVDKASKDFEGMFMSQMLQPMFDTVNVDKTFGGGHGEEMMRGFLVQEYGKAMAKSTNFGIAASVQKQLIATQEKQHDAQQMRNGTTIVPPAIAAYSANSLTSLNPGNGAANATGSLQ